MLAVNGWQLFAHPLFLDQLDKLAAAVERARTKDPRGWRTSANAKLLAALRQLVFETIPQDPTRAEYRQGSTLGDARKHWFRAKFGNGRFRLFFRYSTSAKVIIFAWVNDETTLRTYGTKSDAYAVFRKMLDKGNPPDSWEALMAAATEESARERLEATSPDTP
jgi:toxin YhaV